MKTANQLLQEVLLMLDALHAPPIPSSVGYWLDVKGKHLIQEVRDYFKWIDDSQRAEKQKVLDELERSRQMQLIQDMWHPQGCDCCMCDYK